MASEAPVIIYYLDWRILHHLVQFFTNWCHMKYAWLLTSSFIHCLQVQLIVLVKLVFSFALKAIQRCGTAAVKLHTLFVFNHMAIPVTYIISVKLDAVKLINAKQILKLYCTVRQMAQRVSLFSLTGQMLYICHCNNRL